MTVAAKQSLAHDIEEGIGDYLTVKLTRQVRATVDECLQRYEVEELSSGEICMDMLQSFLDAKRVEGRSPKTIGRYSYILEKLIGGIGRPIEQITTQDLRSYFSAEKERGISDRSLEGLRTICSSFFGWLLKEGMIKTNPCGNFGSIKYRKEVRKPFSSAELERLKRACKTTRDLTMICFLNCTGARISEICALNREDVNLEKQEAKVLGKGNKERTVFIDDVTAELLHDYIDERKDDMTALFIGKRNERLQPGGVRAMLNQIGDAANVENVHPHRFRRTLATNLITKGMPIQKVAFILGHANINTTMTYVYTDKADVESDYRKYM